MGESYFACAERETLEETGLVVKAEKLLTLTNDIFSSEKHYITIFVLCQRVDDTQEPQVCFSCRVSRSRPWPRFPLIPCRSLSPINAHAGNGRPGVM